MTMLIHFMLLPVCPLWTSSTESVGNSFEDMQLMNLDLSHIDN